MLKHALYMCLLMAQIAKSEVCPLQMNERALDLNYETYSRERYHWEAKSFFSMDYKASCNSADYTIQLNIAGVPSQNRSHLIDITSSGAMRANGTRWLRHEVKFFGYKFHGLNESATKIKKSMSINFNNYQFVDVAHTYGVNLGPIEIGARVGVSGGLAVEGGVVEDRSDVDLKLRPKIDIYGYAKLGAEATGLANVWAGGKLSFIKESLQAELKTELQEDNHRAVQMRVTNTVDLLAGKLYLKAKILLTSFEHIFVEFRGYSRSRVVWDSQHLIANDKAPINQLML